MFLSLVNPNLKNNLSCQISLSLQMFYHPIFLQRKLMEKVDGILAVHEFHVWQLTGDRIIASAHIRCLNLAQYMEVIQGEVARVLF